MTEKGSIDADDVGERVVAPAFEEKEGDNNQRSRSVTGIIATGEHDRHHQQHERLLTVGEKCIHLICENLRMFDTKTEILGEMVMDSAMSLSRLSRTCRTMYICVRNLPSVLGHTQPRLHRHSLPHSTIGLDAGYWSDIGGLVWDVSDPRQLLSLASAAYSKSEVECADYNASSTDSSRERNGALLGKLFLHVSNVTGLATLNATERTELVRIVELCGGLSFTLDRTFNPIRDLGLDLRRCKSLRFLHTFAKLEQGVICEQYETLLREFAQMETKPQYASMTITRAEVLADLRALSGFQEIRTFSTTELRSLEGVQDARFVSLRNLCLTDVSALAHVHTVELIQSDSITDVSALGTVHNLSLSYCCCVTDVSALGSVHTLKLSFCDGVSDVSALGSVHTLSLNGCLGITDVSGVAGVNSLRLSMCRNVTNASTLVGKIPHFVL